MLTAIRDVRITSRRSWFCQFRGHSIITPSLELYQDLNFSLLQLVHVILYNTSYQIGRNAHAFKITFNCCKIITDHVDTTTNQNLAAYDRIIFYGDQMFNLVVPNSARPFRYDEEKEFGTIDQGTSFKFETRQIK